jgi:CRP-like cAMP-binding protein
VDDALERCEDILLGGAGIERVDAVPPIPLAGFELLREFSPAEIEALAACLTRCVYETGATLIRDGAAADTLYFIEDGAVDIRIARDGGPGHVRLGAVEAGNVVGELALLGGEQRTAEVVAAGSVSVLELRAESFAALGLSHPAIAGKLLVAIGRSLAARLRRANAEIGALAR